jgi:hypothetical protein
MSSSSKSSTSSTQNYSSETKDNRIVGEAGSVNFADSTGNSVHSTDMSTTIYNSLDAGAVGRSFDFAESVSKGAASLSAASVGAVSDFGKGALAAVQDAYADFGEQVADNSKMTISAITSANAKVNDVLADAYRTSKAGEQKMLAFGALALVAMVAAKAWGRA